MLTSLVAHIRYMPLKRKVWFHNPLLLSFVLKTATCCYFFKKNPPALLKPEDSLFSKIRKILLSNLFVTSTAGRAASSGFLFGLIASTTGGAASSRLLLGLIASAAGSRCFRRIIGCAAGSSTNDQLILSPVSKI